MNRRSKSALFLMEQLVVIGVFSICAAACIWILTVSYITTSNTRDMSNALLISAQAAESYKAAAGNFGKTAEILGGTSSVVGGDEVMLVYYDSSWSLSAEEDAVYFLKLRSAPPREGNVYLLSGELSVNKIAGEEILSFPVAARGMRYE